MTTKYWCDTKDCPNKGIVFEWDNADGPYCNTCAQPLSVEAKAVKK